MVVAKKLGDMHMSSEAMMKYGLKDDGQKNGNTPYEYCPSPAFVSRSRNLLDSVFYIPLKAAQESASDIPFRLNY